MHFFGFKTLTIEYCPLCVCPRVCTCKNSISLNMGIFKPTFRLTFRSTKKDGPYLGGLWFFINTFFDSQLRQTIFKTLLSCPRQINFVFLYFVVMNLGFCRIIYSCNFISKVLDMLNISDSVSCIITQHVQGRLYFTFTQILSSYLVSCVETK